MNLFGIDGMPFGAVIRYDLIQFNEVARGGYFDGIHTVGQKFVKISWPGQEEQAVFNPVNGSTTDVFFSVSISNGSSLGVATHLRELCVVLISNGILLIDVGVSG